MDFFTVGFSQGQFTSIGPNRLNRAYYITDSQGRATLIAHKVNGVMTYPVIRNSPVGVEAQAALRSVYGA